PSGRAHRLRRPDRGHDRPLRGCGCRPDQHRHAGSVDDRGSRAARAFDPVEVTSEIREDALTGATIAVAAARQDRPNQPSDECPFCVGGLKSPEPYDVRAFVNRWPTFSGDRCEVVLYTSDHDATFWSLGVEGASKVVDLWAERSASLGARDSISYVLVFENRGAA